jgi:hypothetical protein
MPEKKFTIFMGPFTKGKKSYAKLKIPWGELPQNDRMRRK